HAEWRSGIRHWGSEVDRRRHSLIGVGARIVVDMRESGSELEVGRAHSLPRRRRTDHRRMPRRLRHDKAGHLYHAMNTAVRGTGLFTTPDDYEAFEHVLLQGLQQVPVHLLSYCA